MAGSLTNKEFQSLRQDGDVVHDLTSTFYTFHFRNERLAEACRLSLEIYAKRTSIDVFDLARYVDVISEAYPPPDRKDAAVSVPRRFEGEIRGIISGVLDPHKLEREHQGKICLSISKALREGALEVQEDFEFVHAEVRPQRFSVDQRRYLGSLDRLADRFVAQIRGLDGAEASVERSRSAPETWQSRFLLGNGAIVLEMKNGMPSSFVTPFGILPILDSESIDRLNREGACLDLRELAKRLDLVLIEHASASTGGIFGPTYAVRRLGNEILPRPVTLRVSEDRHGRDLSKTWTSFLSRRERSYREREREEVGQS